MKSAHAASSRRLWSVTLASLLLVGGALALKPAHAMSALSEGEMAQVSGQAAMPGAPSQQKGGSALPLGGLLGLFTPQQWKAGVLDQAGFEAALAAHGAAPMPVPLYDGRPVAQLVIDSPPVNATMEAGAFFLSNLGVDYRGPSFGTININNLDARGTTLWVWHH